MFELLARIIEMKVIHEFSCLCLALSLNLARKLPVAIKLEHFILFLIFHLGIAQKFS